MGGHQHAPGQARLRPCSAALWIGTWSAARGARCARTWKGRDLAGEDVVVWSWIASSCGSASTVTAFSSRCCSCSAEHRPDHPQRGHYTRTNWISNRVLTSYDNIVDHCADAWNKLVAQPWRIMSLGLPNWAYGRRSGSCCPPLKRRSARTRSIASSTECKACGDQAVRRGIVGRGGLLTQVAQCYHSPPISS